MPSGLVGDISISRDPTPASDSQIGLFVRDKENAMSRGRHLPGRSSGKGGSEQGDPKSDQGDRANGPFTKRFVEPRKKRDSAAIIH